MSAHITEQRKGAPPSEGLLARLCVMMDLLIRNGVDPEDAAQRIMRALLKAGVPSPSEGGDARGWKRLQIWHSKFSARLALAPKKLSAEAKAEYDRFAAEVDALPLNGRMELVIEGEGFGIAGLEKVTRSYIGPRWSAPGPLTVLDISCGRA